MILDNQALLSDNQAVTADVRSTNYIDLGAPGTPFGGANAIDRDIGKGNAPVLLCQVTEAFNNLTTLEVKLESDDNAVFSSAKVVATSGAIALADLVVGKQFPIHIPRGANERYLSLNYDVIGPAPTLGKITAGISAGNQDNV